MTRTSGDHPSWNATFKAFFDFKETIIELLKGWGPPDLVPHLDLTKEGIDAADTAFVTNLGQERNADKLYKIRRIGAGAVYVWLHLELQRKSYKWMAVRMLEYAAAIHQRAIRDGPPSKLAPIIPFVLSQADTGWNAPRFLSELVEINADSPFARFQPKLEYFVLEACNAQSQAAFPLLSGVLRAPYERPDPLTLRRVIEGARTYKNSDLNIVIHSIMRNLVKELPLEETMETPKPDDSEEILDYWDAYLARARAYREQHERERKEIEEFRAQLPIRQAQEARFRGLDAREEMLGRREAEVLAKAEEARRREAEVLAKADEVLAKADEALAKADEAMRREAELSKKSEEERALALESLGALLSSRFDYTGAIPSELPSTEILKAIREAATAATVGDFILAMGWDHA